MGQFLQFVFLGLSAGAIYSVLASSLVGIYAATGIINFAQGAIGLYSVYLVAALRTDGSLVLPIGTLKLGSESDPTSMELALVLGVLSAVVWALLAHVLIFRPLRSAPVLAQVVASVGLMLFIQALVHLRFETENLFAEAILPEDTVDIAGAVVNVSDLILAGVAIAISLVLWAYFRLTTLGVATRAGSEDELAARLSGYSPDRLAAIVWALTGAATGLIVVLASYTIGLTETSYTFFVIPALAVALVGRLTSFGIACAAGLVLGAFQSTITWLTTKDWWPEWAQAGLGDAVPFVIVVIALFLLGGRIPSRGSLGEVRMPAVRIPRIRLIPTVVCIAVVVVAILLTSGSWRFGVVTSVILSLIALSLVLLTGYLGQISLASMAFAGAAGFALSKLTTNWDVPFPFSMIFAALIATGLGVLVGVPALRIRGAQLAVVTLAAALAIQSFVFNNPAITSFEGNLIADPTIFGLDLGVRDGTNLVTIRFSLMVLIVVAIATLVVLRFMGGSTGRAFLAVRSNERAASSVGINVAATKLLGFALSAFLAGIGGCLIGYSRGQLSAGSFTVMIGLTLLAMTYVGGITSFAGAVLAGIIGPLGVGYVFLNQTLALGEYYELFAAGSLLLMAVLNPVGVAGAMSELGEKLRAHRHKPSPRPEAPGAAQNAQEGAHV
ncbi:MULTISPECIES: ABC transporter permease [unclassified Gordonia (in: high G+C Gram-positive bacteria)]|uniref:ABC transporter permease n=1 Tax=Gordonia TaxID=2053 RepID=UPI00071D511C|nr:MULTISPECIES: ABC transporter permease [unclassified Gordonia (in: high G+C Gram-positive bacteria)]KSU61106.1 ABC transporter permease [Gordonia sp. SGD-V-85]MCX2756362.1 ABC transporter permease [Gordonia sp. 4N]MDT0221560.1 ABC transporter permease [Gordonia sp. AC31]UCZ92309.1 ABC transporter permease [Gordonia sp. WA4-43]SCB72535.1 branched-chain amino acid transport system permease protein [Gordonia sp. v-85]